MLSIVGDQAEPMENQQSKLTAICLLSISILLLEAFASRAETSNTTDQEIQDAETRLTGGGSRAWIFERLDTYMGGSDECHHGRVYHFATDHTLTEEHCVNGHVKTDPHKWRVAKSGPLDLILEIDNQQFVLLFKSESNGMLMRLRTFGESKTQPTTDEEFRFESE
jgi:hypothetical protein